MIYIHDYIYRVVKADSHWNKLQLFNFVNIEYLISINYQ